MMMRVRYLGQRNVCYHIAVKTALPAPSRRREEQEPLMRAELLKALAGESQETGVEEKLSSTSALSLSLHHPTHVGTLCTRGLLRWTKEAGAWGQSSGSGLSVLPRVRGLRGEEGN